ncbi:hypothetical protein C1M55_11725 [Rhodococcus qingshengii]|uniref:DUF7426 family protein n=1 Tax=Rhodococcus TaxID=1827 RepID=UPI000977BA12|nr:MULTISPECIES: hypothetical protein [Rhodococcus]AUS31710.1 hypothetical protein C1M55_11725 [Rhodococcus qingshengii]MCC4304233.1 hypothetical protein [Rhodococcus sp. 3-2]OMQ36704.1 hypothetical protein BK799_08900 [Rhodococcus sp. D-1]
MRDLAELMDPELTLNIEGQEFRVSCSARQGLHVSLMMTEKPVLTDAQELEEVRFILGDTWQQMVDAGISEPKRILAGRTAMVYFGYDKAVGRAFGEGGGVTPGNPLPPSQNQKAMGERIRKLFRK